MLKALPISRGILAWMWECWLIVLQAGNYWQARGFDRNAWNVVPVRTACLSFLVSFSYTIIISHGLRCLGHYFFQQSSGIKDVSLHKARCPCAHIKGYSLSLAQVRRHGVTRSCFATCLSAKEEPIDIHQEILWVFTKKLRLIGNFLTN